MLSICRKDCSTEEKSTCILNLLKREEKWDFLVFEIFSTFENV